MKVDVHPQTARKNITEKKLPEEFQVKHTWRTREDPLVAIGPEAQRILEGAPELEVKELFEHLLAMRPDGILPKHLHKLQRRASGTGAFSTVRTRRRFCTGRAPRTGHLIGLEHVKNPGVSVAGHVLDHFLCHAVLPYSNWEWAVRCEVIRSGLFIVQLVR